MINASNIIEYPIDTQYTLIIRQYAEDCYLVTIRDTETPGKEWGLMVTDVVVFNDIGLPETVRKQAQSMYDMFIIGKGAK